MQNMMRQLASVVAGGVIGAASLALGISAATAASLGGPMELQDEGNFFIAAKSPEAVIRVTLRALRLGKS